MAWSGTYTKQITKNLSNLANSKYNSQYDPDINATADAIKNYGDYTSKYQPQIDSTVNTLQNWNYDPESDQSYQAYKTQYTNLGNRAMRDTLGQVSARTGGLASSYAGSAAQQSYNNYMDQLAAIIPQLENQAYSRAQNNLSMYQNLDNTDYSRWYNALQNLYNQNNMYLNLDQNAFNRYSTDLSNQQSILSAMQAYDDEEYARYQDALAKAASGGSGGSGGGYYSGGSSGTGTSSGSDGYSLISQVRTGLNGGLSANAIKDYIASSDDSDSSKALATTWLNNAIKNTNKANNNGTSYNVGSKKATLTSK